MFTNLLKAGCLAAVLAVSTTYAIPDDKAMVKVNSSHFTSNMKKTLSADTMWFLEGSVVVPATCTLHINPGTWIYGTYSSSDINETSILVIAPNGILEAEGKADSTIVFTNIRDEKKDKGDFGPGAKGLWGGIIWVGEATISRPAPYTPEGVPTDLGILYGGTNDSYYGGKMKYVSIRHGGCAIASGSETNALSMYALGSATEISYVEAFANSDDGFEFFGGTVNTHHLTSAFCNDDHFDLDEGYRGKNQFWFAIEQEYEGDRGGEWDGKIDATNLFVSNPTIYNYTFIGSGNPTSGRSSSRGITMRDSLKGTFCNGIVTEFGNVAFDRNKQSDGYNVVAAAYDTTGNGIVLRGNIVWNCGTANAWANAVYPASDAAYASLYNKLEDPQLRGISRTQNASLDPRPSRSSPAINSGVAEPSDPFFTDVYYVGAFDTTNLWIGGWTALEELGHLKTVCNWKGTRLRISYGTTTKHQATAPLTLQFWIESKLATVPTLLPTSFVQVLVDGVDMTSTFRGMATGPYSIPGPCYGSRVWNVTLSSAQMLVPSAGGQFFTPVKGGHTIRLIWALNDGITYETSSMIELF